ncbi:MULTISPECIES: DUF3937 family protein [unclassified Bacillus (in: firmicutes)]|uniref:DUF3937 family protein n=1 Tax=unclassified Bacillus (in: firmicutes) TaxID=185979 RepID=UPI001C9B3321|nr:MULTISPECIES: DUF3937 family protein [unclassified Bacillus (in: firmicutes)]MBY7125159.1 DUF3937 family protein [Bacillus sp. 16GRE42]MCR6850183.1 DUF3937 domain-containing protein [Bacillus sp. IBL03825]
MNFERCYMFTNKKFIRFGLTLFVCLSLINFTISYFQTYLERAADIIWVIPEIWQTILIDVPQGILVLLGAIALYDFTKETSQKDASI